MSQAAKVAMTLRAAHNIAERCSNGNCPSGIYGHESADHLTGPLRQFYKDGSGPVDVTPEALAFIGINEKRRVEANFYEDGSVAMFADDGYAPAYAWVVTGARRVSRLREILGVK